MEIHARAGNFIARSYGFSNKFLIVRPQKVGDDSRDRVIETGDG
jgi:hypothetical protein